MKILTKKQNKQKNFLNTSLGFVKTHGVSFAVYALAMDVLDELVIPAIFAYSGHPIIGGAVMLGDLDFITYPFYFVVRSAMQKLRIINL